MGSSNSTSERYDLLFGVPVVRDRQHLLPIDWDEVYGPPVRKGHANGAEIRRATNAALAAASQQSREPVAQPHDAKTDSREPFHHQAAPQHARPAPPAPPHADHEHHTRSVPPPQGSFDEVRESNPIPPCFEGEQRHASSSHRAPPPATPPSVTPPVTPQPNANGGGDLPAGDDWHPVEGSEYMFSEASGLYFHPATGLFYDEASDSFFDEAKQQWIPATEMHQ